MKSNTIAGWFRLPAVRPGFQPQLGIVFTCRALGRVERPVHHAEAPEVVLLVQCGIHFDLSFQLLYVFPILLKLHLADNRQFEVGFYGYRETPEIELAMQTEYFAEKPVIHIQFASRIDQLAVFDGKIFFAKEYLFVAIVDQVAVFFFCYKSANGVERCRGFGFYLQEPENSVTGRSRPDSYSYSGLKVTPPKRSTRTFTGISSLSLSCASISNRFEMNNVNNRNRDNRRGKEFKGLWFIKTFLFTNECHGEGPSVVTRRIDGGALYF